jgi:rhodanese-related sulfurtransferase
VPEERVLTATDVQRITPIDALELVTNGTAVLLDTRSLEQFNQAHIAGALPFPEASAAEYYPTLPSGMMLIFYCT